jgi:xylan 1,4-beta-xylosidase
MTPLIEIGFMPKDLSTKPEPYQHSWSTKGPFWTGWTQPPDDYDKWAELVYQWVVHSIQRYGQEEVERWLWEVWNEPDIGYWSGTFEEYCKLYDYAVDAVKRACPECTVGGPHTTSPGGKSGFPYLMDFLEHCIRGTNYATGETGSPLDYVGFHAKGSPRLVDGHIRMNMGTQLNDVKTGMEVVSSFPELAGIPIIVGEFDPEGCAACSEEREPQYGYRNGTMFSSYVASSVAKVYELTDGSDANLRGILSWAFTFENQPWFAGFRELATHGVDKPVLNTFRMLGMMSGDRVVVTTDEPVRAVEVIEKGVRERPDINALAARGEDNLTVMIWNYHDDDLPADAAEIELSIDGLPDGRILAHHYRVDREFSNSFEEWKRMGRPQEVSDDEYQQIEKSGQLQLLHAPQWLSSNDGRTTIPFSLPRQGVSFIRLTWDD